jgi:N-methylhydantoinase B
MKLDAVLLEVIRNRFSAIAEEMGASLVRTSYSTNIKDRRDCSCALFSLEGEVIAQAEHIPVHLGVLPFGVRGALAKIDLTTLNPGDVVMHNDPYVGGTHLPDIIIISPIFLRDELVGFVGNLAHHSDMGGMVTGSLPPRASEIFQEGIRFPPVKIRKAGVVDEEILSIYSNNVRTPNDGRGDLFAQMAANNVGERRFIELCDEFGLDIVKAGILELERYSERRMAAELEQLPAGTFTFEDRLESDGFSEDPIVFRVKMISGGGRLVFDFTGTSPQTQGPINAVRPITMAAVYYVVKAVTDPAIPPNAGTFRRIEVITPEGTVVNARFPAATNAANGATSQRLVDVLLGVMAQAVPLRVCAAATGSMNSIQIGGYNSATRSYYVHPETYGGGYGATHGADGSSGVQTHMTNTRNAPVEVLESTLPVIVEGYGLVPDSEGAGRYRGGFGLRRRFRITADGVTCIVSTDRALTGPWGLDGGQNARGTHVFLQRGAETQRLASKVQIALQKGDRLTLETAGGGGWGDAHTRTAEAVAKDVAEELISPERAAERYGYVGAELQHAKLRFAS